MDSQLHHQWNDYLVIVLSHVLLVVVALVEYARESVLPLVYVVQFRAALFVGLPFDLQILIEHDIVMA